MNKYRGTHFSLYTYTHIIGIIGHIMILQSTLTNNMVLKTLQNKHAQ